MTTLTYDDFLMSQSWNDHLEKIGDLNPQVAEAIGNLGIGEDLSPDGGYDYEAGNLLVWLPEEIQAIIHTNRNLYDSICNLADSYAEFCKGE